MSRTLAASLGWVAPSERLSKTVERAQLCAYHEGAQEVEPGHFFSAALEDLDAVYFLAQHGIPLVRLEDSQIASGQAVQNVPRLAAPSYSTQRAVSQPHLDIPASARLRRVLALASALAENRSMIEVHGGLALEAMLEDGKSQAAETLKGAHAAVAQETGQRLAPLPGSGHQGAILAVQPPQKAENKKPAPQRIPLNSLEQVRWLKEQVARALEQERPYRFLQELNVFAANGRPYASIAALQIREEAQADLTANPVFLAHAELQSAERAVQEADARTCQAALRVADVKPQIFNGLLPLVSDGTASALKAALQARNSERVAMAAMQAQSIQNSSPLTAPEPEPDTSRLYQNQPSASWSRISFPRPLIPQRQPPAEAVLDDQDGDLELGSAAGLVNSRIEKNDTVRDGRWRVFPRLGRIWTAAAAAGAGVLTLLL